MPSVFELQSTEGIALSLLGLVLLLVLVGVDITRRVRRRTDALRGGGGESGGSGAGPGGGSEGPQSSSRGADTAQFSMLSRAGVALAVTSAGRTRHPILLVHGYFGFDAIGVSRIRREYFRGVRAALEALGYDVHVAKVAPAASIELRAAQLAGQIRRLSAERVNVIAHSMGGLDARYAIAHLGIADRVASLITIGTPHRGTPVADRGTRFVGEWRRVRRALHAVGANVDGLYDLTTKRMEEFNRAVPDAPTVTYASVVGAVFGSKGAVPRVLSRAHAYLEKLAGPNDGLVPADSQRWGHVLAEVDANHWAQIGWSSSFDARGFYAAIAAHLAETGY